MSRKGKSSTKEEDVSQVQCLGYPSLLYMLWGKICRSTFLYLCLCLLSSSPHLSKRNFLCTLTLIAFRWSWMLFLYVSSESVGRKERSDVLMVRGNVQQDRYWIQQQLLKRWVCLIKETEASFKIVKPQINLITDWLELDILYSFSVAGILSWCLYSCNWIIISSHVLWANELLALLQSNYIRQSAGFEQS